MIHRFILVVIFFVSNIYTDPIIEKTDLLGIDTAPVSQPVTTSISSGSNDDINGEFFCG